MRVVLVNPVGALGGAERVLVDLVRVARARAPDIRFHLLSFTPGPLLDAVRALGAEAEVVEMPDALAALGDSQARRSTAWKLAHTAARMAVQGVSAARYARRLRERIEALRPDLVHSNGLKAHFMTAPIREDVPVVWHLHDFLGERPLARHALRMVARSVSAAIAISRSVADDATACLPGVPVEVIPNGVDLQRFSPGPGDGAWLDALAGQPAAPAGTVRVGLVATYARWKGQDVFLDSVPRTLPRLRGEPVRFYVIGGPVYRTAGSQFSEEELRARAAALGVSSHVAFVPFQEDTPRVYRSLDVVVHASTRPEPFGLTIAEAMACGRAVVTSRTGGAVELYVNEVEAVGLSPVSADGLAAVVAELVRDPERRAALGRAAREAAVARHSSERCGEAVIALYRRLVKPAPAGQPARA